MSNDALRKAIAKYQSQKARVNIWMSPDGKDKLAEYAKTTPEKSVQKYLLRLIRKTPALIATPRSELGIYGILLKSYQR